MAAQFKEILKQTIPYYQQGAPLLLEAHAVYEDTATGMLIAQLKWRNLSHQTVQAVNVTLHCKDSFGATLEASTYQYIDVSAAPQGIFGSQNAITLVSERTRLCEVTITGVSFADGSIWSATREDTCKALPAGKFQTLSGALLSQFERDVADRGFSTAVKFTPQTYGDLWQCGCGSWQKQDDDTCTSCKATMTQLAELSEPVALAGRLAAYQQQLEDNRIAKEKADAEKKAKAEAERVEQEKRNEALRKEQAAAQTKAKKRNILIAAVLTVAVAAVLVFTQVIQPKQKYEAAVALMESGQYEEASAAFAELGQYSDAAERVNEPFYMQAEELLADGQYDEASAAFTKAGDYSNAADRIGEPFYVQAEALLANGEYDAATNAFKMAGSYSDASERAKKIYYTQAEALLADGRYEEASVAFIQAGKYSDAADRIGEPYYIQAEALLANGEFDAAVVAFTKAGDYCDAAERVNKTHYAQAEALLANGQYDEAIKVFDELGTYSDAVTQVLESKYQKGLSILASGDVASAYTLLLTIKGYKDVESLMKNNEKLATEAARRESFTQVGSIVNYGHYEQDNNTANGQEAIQWQVLAYDASTNQSLLISKYGLDTLAYEQYGYESPIWEESKIRSWLSRTFMTTAFSQVEQTCLVKTKISTAYGGADTEDLVFLLSMDEAYQYFSSNEARQAAPTAYAVAQGAFQSGDDEVDGEGCCDWWLRSPDYGTTITDLVLTDGSIGTIQYDTVSQTIFAVRPAFWLDLSAL